MLCPAFRLRYLFTHLCSCPVSRPAVSENQNGMLAGHAAKCPIYSASRTGIRPFCSNSGLDWKRSGRNNYPLGFDSRCRERKRPKENPRLEPFWKPCPECPPAYLPIACFSLCHLMEVSPALCCESICRLYIIWAKYRAKALCNQGKRSLPLSIRQNVPAVCLPDLQQL